MKRTTIKDIANNLNLSISTVSRALADGANIRRETKEKIFAAAEALGYKRNIHAATLRTGRSNTIAVMVNQMVSPYASSVLRGIHNRMHEEGIIVRVCDSDSCAETERRNVRLAEQSLIDGMIVAHCHEKENIEEYRRLLDRGMPIVFFPCSLEGLESSCVGVNSYDKAFYLLDHMVCGGCRRIVNIQGPSVSEDMKNLDRAYRDSMQKFGIIPDPQLTRRTGLTTEAGKRVVEELLSEGVAFDGIFAPNELVGIGAMQALHERGIKIPDEVSVAAFSGSELSQMVYPQLTTVDPHHEDMGYKAADLLIRKINRPDMENEKIIVDAKIRLRGSSQTVMRKG